MFASWKLRSGARRRGLHDNYTFGAGHAQVRGREGQPGVSTPNCFAYSAFNRCQPPNFMASAPTMRPMGRPARSRSSTSKQMCQPAAPIDMNPRSMLCQSVSRVPPPPSGSSSQRMSCPPQLNSSTLGASARFTWVSDTCGVGTPTVESFAVPTVPRFRSESNGAHSRRCSGSVSAFQTFAGGWGRSRTRTSVHFSPSFRTSAPEAAPGAYCSRLLMSFLSFHRGHLLHLVQVLLKGSDVLRPEAPEGNEPCVELHERLRSQSIEAPLRFNS